MKWRKYDKERASSENLNVITNLCNWEGGGGAEIVTWKHKEQTAPQICPSNHLIVTPLIIDFLFNNYVLILARKIRCFTMFY